MSSESSCCCFLATPPLTTKNEAMTRVVLVVELELKQLIWIWGLPSTYVCTSAHSNPKALGHPPTSPHIHYPVGRSLEGDQARFTPKSQQLNTTNTKQEHQPGDKTNKRRQNKKGKETKPTNMFVSPCLCCLILLVLSPVPCLVCVLFLVCVVSVSLSAFVSCSLW